MTRFGRDGYWSLAIGLAFVMLALTVTAGTRVSTLKADEELLFYPAPAYCASDGKSWLIDIQGCVYEPDQRSVTLAALKRSLQWYGLRLTSAEEKLLSERARLFMLDNESGREVIVRIGDQVFSVGKSCASGHFSGTVRLGNAQFTKLASGAGGRVNFSAVMPAGDDRQFTGQAFVFGQSKLLVISDVDDTIKITQVTHPQLMLRNTFLDPFRPVPDMAGVYRSWAEANQAEFCYVSASPWQLFTPLSEFVRSNNFPSGLFWLKEVRFTDKTIRNLFEAPDAFKPRVLESLLLKYKQSRFVLVGDSGEKDPEVYGALARKYPDLVQRILIRDVTGEGRATARYKEAFRDVPDEKWMIFRRASDLPKSLP